MGLPANEKRTVDPSALIKLWIYGMPTIGKSKLADSFPNAIFANTDGNMKYTTSPYVRIVDWKAPSKYKGKDVEKFFVDFVEMILKGDHDFETIIVDLTEDVYQFCRTHWYSELGVVHESDAGYGKGYDIIRNDFLINLRKLANAPYNIIFLSHEVPNQVKSRTGIESTHYSTPLPDKVANKVSGMVEMTARMKLDVEGNHILQIAPSNDEFGGNRVDGLIIETLPVPLGQGYEAVANALEEAHENAKNGIGIKKPSSAKPKSTSKRGRSSKRGSKEKEDPKTEPTKLIAEDDMYLYDEAQDEFVLISQGDEYDESIFDKYRPTTDEEVAELTAPDETEVEADNAEEVKDPEPDKEEEPKPASTRRRRKTEIPPEQKGEHHAEELMEQAESTRRRRRPPTTHTEESKEEPTEAPAPRRRRRRT